MSLSLDTAQNGFVDIDKVINKKSVFIVLLYILLKSMSLSLDNLRCRQTMLDNLMNGRIDLSNVQINDDNIDNDKVNIVLVLSQNWYGLNKIYISKYLILFDKLN